MASSIFHKPLYMACKGCGDEMVGITDYTARKLCESCGGNQSPYGLNNPRHSPNNGRESETNR